MMFKNLFYLSLLHYLLISNGLISAVHAISSQVHLLSCPFPADGFLHDVSLNVTPELRVSEVEIWQPLDTGTYRILSEEDLVMQKNGHLSCSVKVEREIERGHILALRGSAYGSNFPATIRYKISYSDSTTVTKLLPVCGKMYTNFPSTRRHVRLRRQGGATLSTQTMNSTPAILLPLTNSNPFTSPLTTSGGEVGDSGGTGSENSGDILSPAAVTVVVVSVFLLLLLVVLVAVLVACIFSKKSVKRSFVPTDRAQENGEGGGGSSSNLAASSSTDQNHASSSTSPRPLSQQTTTTHTYMNAEITQFGGAFRPFTPLYVNSDDESIRELMSDKGSHFGSRSREGRGWSVVSSRSDRTHNFVNQHQHLGSTTSQLGHTLLHNTPSNNQQRERRAQSVSSASHHRVERQPSCFLPRPNTYANNLSSISTKPLPPLPPEAANPALTNGQNASSQPQLFNLPPPTHTPPPPKESPTAARLEGHRNQLLLYPEVSGDYTSPVPVSERYKYDPTSRMQHVLSADMGGEVRSMGSRPISLGHCHDYSEPEEPEKEGSPNSIFRYDHLSDDIHPDMLSSNANLPGHNPDSDDAMSGVGYSHGYVPTEEQRRIMLLNNGGHYEMADEIENSQVIGYDHLNYFRESETYWAPAATTEDLYTQLAENKYREIFRHELSVLNGIGSGHFGSVSKGVWFNGRSSEDVAIKIMKNNDEQERLKLLQEAAIMGQFAHKNVVRLHGVVTMGEPVLVVLEFMQKGDLKSFLQKLHPRVSKRKLPEVVPSMFVKFSKDIANGMSYLSKKCFIHRDLAARNILLSNDLTCKIGDFGMARDVENEGDYYKSHGGIIPVKWTAPEALHYNKYSSASDVWSYGMVLFEIWSLGEKPYGDFSNRIVIALVSSKHCQPPPPGCPRPIYHLMVECWNPEHSCRPTFDSIYDYFDSPDESLLQWPVIGGGGSHEHHTGARNLGDPLGPASELYLDLQRTYQNPQPESNR